MKLTEMIHRTVLAFEPKRHPVYALTALAMMLITLVALAYLSGSSVASLLRPLL